MKPSMRMAAMSAAILPAFVLMGCDKMSDTSRAMQETTYKAFNDTKSSWRDFFTYHPPEPPPLPQTRYCYQMQSDVVCYDSEQPMLTSKLIGFQDGETISWVQPGGGSLGASGGAPVALRPVPKRYSATNTKSVNDFLPFKWPDEGNAAASNSNNLTPSSSATTYNAAPQSGIEVNSLPPINSVAKVGQKVN